ncbi:MAG: gfo/Idh/MocA family oxidoreductase [Bacteroidetes bacterium]|nr:MAG: gfo/Idh/MocA family oxidoreductase [Bacteroidota bacterium]
MITYLKVCLFLMGWGMMNILPAPAKPLRVGVAGLTHGHVHWILRRAADPDIEIVGIAEPTRDLAQRLTRQYGLSMDIVYTDLKQMLDETRPDAVTAFNDIFGHLAVVEACAPRGIHVMVEKPLAVSLAHARKMHELATHYGIHLLTNYETTWYPSNHQLYQMTREADFGEIRKMVVHDGHQGPIEIGCNAEFLEWLTDPHLNGGGALTDFGCYGANLISWMMKGERPLSVMALTQQIKPAKYPKVDDEATIVLQYQQAQGIIQASWNWPYSRKDMEVYGTYAAAFADNRYEVRSRAAESKEFEKRVLKEREEPYHDPFAFFAAVIREDITLPPYDLSSLENNMLVMEILEAAKESASTGKVVKLKIDK